MDSGFGHEVPHRPTEDEAEWVVDNMMSRVDWDVAHEVYGDRPLGLVQLATLTGPGELSETVRARLTETNPELLARIEASMRRQADNRDYRLHQGKYSPQARRS